METCLFLVELAALEVARKPGNHAHMQTIGAAWCWRGSWLFVMAISTYAALLRAKNIELVEQSAESDARSNRPVSIVRLLRLARTIETVTVQPVQIATLCSSVFLKKGLDSAHAAAPRAGVEP